MENLFFCLNATVPVFLLIVAGYIFKKIHLFDDHFVDIANKFVFKAALPALLFKDLATADFASVWDGNFVLFCFVVTICSILISLALSFLLKNKSDRGEFVQASYRSSAALLGIALIQSLYGDSGMAPLMIIGAVPLYNVMAVIILELTRPRLEDETSASLSSVFLRSLKGILTNPIIIGIVVGLLWSLLRIPQPIILSKFVGYLSALATPLGLMAMGATFQMKAFVNDLKPALASSFLKLIGFTGIFLPIAVLLGFRESSLVSILIMLGSPTTVTSFVMARNMGHSGTISSNVVMITTLFSAFTITLFLYIIKSMGLI